MIGIKDLYRVQSEYGVAQRSFRDSDITFMEYLAQCRVFIAANLPKAYSDSSLDQARKSQLLMDTVEVFVEEHKVPVRGYMDSTGAPDTSLLLADLVDHITGDSVLREALEDPAVDEIQINDSKTIFVIKNGVTQYYTDSHGRVMQFGNNDEVHTTLNRLIDDGTGNTPQFTDGVPILNAKTAQHQYRVNAVHYAANTRGKPPHNEPVTSVTIRKFKENNLVIDDLIHGGSCTEQMGRLLLLLGRSEANLFCVGPMGSGKTTLLRIVASTISPLKRLLLVQNPTEISFFETDEYGRNKRNVLHHEVIQTQDGSRSTDATMENLVSNTMRETPEVICVGEVRASSEFVQLLRLMRTGVRVLGTYHSGSTSQAVDRFASELSGSTDALTERRGIVASVLDVVITQYRFENGDFRIMSIAEVLGTDEKGNSIVNTLFEFQMNGNVIPDGKGGNRVDGEFVRVGALSEKLQNQLFKAAVTREEIKEFTEPPEKRGA